MRKNKIPGGKIIATASIVGIHPHSSYPEYCGAKAAVIHFARTVAPVLKVVSSQTHLNKLPLLIFDRKKM
jgi:NAD(P)-dependent dehydrogenase (short-subunit alcohol dehydrogenase family)